VTGDIVLLGILLIPIALWGLLRYLPEQRRRQGAKPARPAGPRKRWWQP